jgi:hypothetical protein
MQLHHGALRPEDDGSAGLIGADQQRLAAIAGRKAAIYMR